MITPSPSPAVIPTAEALDAAESLLIELSRLRLLADKVAHVHGSGHPEMVLFAAAAGSITNTFAGHVARLNDGATTIPAADAAQIRADVVRLRTLSNAFTPWTGSCASVYLLLRGWAQAAAKMADLLMDA